MSGEEKRPVFLNAKQIAERYGVSKQWAYHDPDMTRLRVQAGRRVVWRLSDIEALEAQESGRGVILDMFRQWELEKKRKLLKFDIA